MFVRLGRLVVAVNTVIIKLPPLPPALKGKLPSVSPLLLTVTSLPPVLCCAAFPSPHGCAPPLGRYPGPRDCRPGTALAPNGRCLTVRDAAMSYEVEAFWINPETGEEELAPFQLPSVVAERRACGTLSMASFKLSLPAAAKTAAAAAKAAGRSRAPATLPDNSVLVKVVFTADTSVPPQAARGVRCGVTTFPDVITAWTNATTGEEARMM